MPASQDRKQVDLGGLIKRLLIMSPFNKLSEEDKMLAAGLLGGAMNEAIRLSQVPYSAADVLNSPDAYVGYCHSKGELTRPCPVCGKLREDETGGPKIGSAAGSDGLTAVWCGGQSGHPSVMTRWLEGREAAVRAWNDGEIFTEKP